MQRVCARDRSKSIDGSSQVPACWPLPWFPMQIHLAHLMAKWGKEILVPISVNILEWPHKAKSEWRQEEHATCTVFAHAMLARIEESGSQEEWGACVFLLPTSNLQDVQELLIVMAKKVFLRAFYQGIHEHLNKGNFLDCRSNMWGSFELKTVTDFQNLSKRINFRKQVYWANWEAGYTTGLGLGSTEALNSRAQDVINN